MITIRVEGRGPPSGEVAVDEGAPIPFAGWLQLLGILSDALFDPGSPGLAHGLRGELDPGGDAQLGEDVGQVGVNGVP